MKNGLMTIQEAIEHCAEKADCSECGKEHAQLGAWLEELLQYQELGTVEELRAAREKQMPKTPAWSRHCHECGAELDSHYKKPYCAFCGQKVDWREVKKSDIDRYGWDANP